MADNVEDAMPQLLQAIQKQIVELRAAMDSRFTDLEARVDARFNHVDEVLRKHRRDNSGLLVMAKSLAGNFT